MDHRNVPEPVVPGNGSGGVNADGSELDVLLDMVMAQCRAGRSVDLEELVNAHPEQESQLRQAVPAPIALELSSSATEATEATLNLGAPRVVLQGERTLGDFKLLREVGRGGMGVVYEAEQISLGRRVALKVLPMAGLLDERQLQRFRNEARAAASLHHPNIVPVYSVGTEHAVHFYAMQLIEGQTLADFIQQMAPPEFANKPLVNRSSALERLQGSLAAMLGSRRLADKDEERSTVGLPRRELDADDRAGDERAAAETVEVAEAITQGSLRSNGYFRLIAELGIQVAEALEYAHSLGIVHRDIKPSNLLLDGSGKVWVADFGLAHIEADAGMTMTGDLLGTLRYMSPEQTLGQRGMVDGRADIYSLGISLYELLTARPAFPTANRQQLLRQLVEQEPVKPRQLNPAIPKDLETIVLKAIAKDPQQRYATAQELAEDLRRLLHHEPVRAKRPTLVDRSRKWLWRHPSLVAASILVLLTTSVAFGVSTALISTAYEQEGKERQRAEQAAEQARQQERNLAHLLARQQLERGVKQIAEDEPSGLLDLMEAYATAKEIPELQEPIGRLWAVAYGLWEDRLTQVLPLRGRYQLSANGGILLATIKDNTFQAYDTRSWQPVGPIMQHVDSVEEIALSPDGKIAACLSKDGTAQMWDVATSTRLGAELRHGRVEHALEGYRFEHAIAFSPDGTVLATGGADRTARLWKVPSGKPLHSPLPHEGPVLALAFSPDNQTLITTSKDTMDRRWRVITGEQLSGYMEHHSGDSYPCISSDGSFVATWGPLAVWQTETALLIGRVIPSDPVEAVFSPDSRLLAVASVDRTCRLFKVPSL